jgi:hypothetical protein
MAPVIRLYFSDLDLSGSGLKPAFGRKSERINAKTKQATHVYNNYPSVTPTEGEEKCTGAYIGD